ncbi:MAG: aldo/keto reductase [Alphaproteobacteria bacterium]
MQYNTLGYSDLKVSRLCMGTMNFSTQVDKSTTFEILDHAFDFGYDFFDTAEMYPVPTTRNKDIQGKPEEWLGEWLKTKPREKVVVATKVTGPSGMTYIPTRRVPPAPEGNTSLRYKEIISAAEGCLRRLNTDYIDLFQVHWPARYVGGLFGDMRYRPENEREPSADFSEVAAAMNDLIGCGKVRHWGVSNENAFGLARYDEVCRSNELSSPVSIQNDFSLMNRTFEPELAEACSPRNLDISLLVYGGLAGGALSGKYLKDKYAPGRHTEYPNFQPRYNHPLAQPAIARYIDLAESIGITGTELALSWMLTLPYVGSIITGASHPSQIREHSNAAYIKLDGETIDAIDAIQADHQNPCNWTMEYRP